MDDVKRAADEYNKMAHGRPGRDPAGAYTMRFELTMVTASDL